MEIENAVSAPYLFLFNKTKTKKRFVDIGSESRYINNWPTYVFIFSQYEINERTFQLYSQVYFLGLISWKIK